MMQSKIKKIMPMMTKRKEAIPKYSRNPSSNGGGVILNSSYNIVPIGVVVDN